MLKPAQRRGSLLLIELLALGLFLQFGLTIQTASAVDEYDNLRGKWKTVLTGGSSFNTTDPDIAARISGITTTAQGYWNNLDTGSSRTYLWSDLASTTDSYAITLSYDRLRAMALAYSTTSSSLAGNTSLKADVIGALDWLHANRYYTRAEYDNWWDWEIGVPLRLNDIVIMLYADLTLTQITNWMDVVNYFAPDPNRINNGLATGANRVWEATVVGLRGVIIKSSERIGAARDALSDVNGNGANSVFKYVSAGDGFYTDGSFIQHSKHPYTGGYGTYLLVYLADFIYLLNGSSWGITDPNEQNLYKWIYDSYEPVVYKGATMDIVRGREISRYTTQDHLSGHTLIGAIVRISQFAPGSDALNYQKMIKYWVSAETYRDYYQDVSVSKIVATKVIMADSTIPARGELVTHRRFARMDRVVHLRPGWGLALSLSSNRIYNYESWSKNGAAENRRGWYTGDGMTYLYNGDLGQYSEDFWATVNAYRLPGTTVDTQSRSSGSGGSYLSSKNWVGGTSILGLYGVSGMELDAYSSNLTARKAWFMFDDEVVALGSGITNSAQTGNGWDGTPRHVETIVENRRISTSTGANELRVDNTLQPATPGWSATLSDVNWIHLQGNGTGDGPDIGYYFPGGASLKALRETRTDNWNSVNTQISNPTSITRNYLSLWFDHGTNPTGATYAYVLLPGQNPTQVSSYASNPDIVILENSAAAQAVKETSLNIVAANFWEDASKTVNVGGTAFLTSDKKASVMTKETTGSSLEIAVSDPTQLNTGLVNLEIQRSALCTLSADPQVTVSQLSPTIKLAVNVNAAKGRTLRAKFSLASCVGSSISLNPVADSYVRDGSYATTNFGSDPSLAVKTGSSGFTRKAYLKFDVSSVSSASTARLRLYLHGLDSGNPSASVSVYGVTTDSWTEGGLNWNNKPAASGNALDTRTVQAFGYYEFDVSSFVQSQLTGDNTVTLMLEGVGSNGAYFDSQENTNLPELVIA